MLLRTVVVVVGLFLFQAISGFIFFSDGGESLESYNVDQAMISVSGISSGAAMATQLHVIHSKTFMGVGLIAGVPFACAAGQIAKSTTCMTLPGTDATDILIKTTEAGDRLGNVDATSNMANDRVYIFDGSLDSVVNPSSGKEIKQFYQHFITDASSIKTVFNINAQHGQPTDNYGAACRKLNVPTYMNNCNYSAAYELLNFVYGGNLHKPSATTQANGELKQFSQSDFFYISTPSQYSMDTIGYVYIPTGCKNKTKVCRLHVAIHGCGMGRTTIGDVYVKHAGYNEVGELNDIIILYPQLTMSLMNPAGCWDWWGYTGTLYATNSGFQITALKRMVDKISGQ